MKIKAFQMTGARSSTNAEWPKWLNLAWRRQLDTDGSVYYNVAKDVLFITQPLFVRTFEGLLAVKKDHWLIQESNGNLLVCGPEEFERKYKEVKNGS